LVQERNIMNINKKFKTNLTWKMILKKKIIDIQKNERCNWRSLKLK
jgi:hypothetical protein